MLMFSNITEEKRDLNQAFNAVFEGKYERKFDISFYTAHLF